MRKYFITGLVILLPVALTVIIVVFLVTLLTGPFIEFVQSILVHYGLVDQGFLFLSAKQLQYVFSQVLILCTLFFLTLSLGFIARWFLIHYLIQAWDYMLHRIPLISSVYKTSQDIIQTVLTSDIKSFKQVVLVPFPSPESHTIGLVTRENLKGIPGKENERLTAVFIPTTPNPTSGYLVIYNEKELTYLDMKVEEALKYIISCGVILNEPFKELTREIEETSINENPEKNVPKNG